MFSYNYSAAIIARLVAKYVWICDLKMLENINLSLTFLTSTGLNSYLCRIYTNKITIIKAMRLIMKVPSSSTLSYIASD